MPAIHQFVATFEQGAIGSYALELQKAFCEQGYESEIFAEFCRAPYDEIGHIHTDYGSKVLARQSDLLIYHMAIGSNVADWLMDQNQRLVVLHHNITPVEYYQPWNPGVTYGMAWGRDQLRRLAKHAVLGIGVSEYNRRELEDLHYAKTAEVPIVVDIESLRRSLDQSALDLLKAGRTEGSADWLFVGWIAPHKCQHDIINAFALYRAVYDPHARLHLVGRVGEESYAAAVERLIAELNLQDAVQLHGRVSDGELGAHYANADVLVSMSEHEGVGIPLVEAMYNSVPVVAFAAAAVPETVGRGGILLPRKSPALVAAAANRVVMDATLRKAMVDHGLMQAQRFAGDSARAQLFEVLDPLLQSDPQGSSAS